MDLKTKLEELAQASIAKIDESASLQAVEDLRVKLLGKKGELTDLLKMMRDLSKEERPVIGKLANEIRDDLTTRIGDKKEALEEKRPDTCDSSSHGRNGRFILRHGLQHYRRNGDCFRLLKL